MKIVYEAPLTLIAILLSVALISAAAFANIDLVQINLKLLEGIEKNEVDDLIIGFFLIITCLIIDRLRAQRRRRAEIAEQRLFVLKATMRTVHDIVNNFLNNLHLFRLETEDALSSESKALFDELIQETAAKLKTLGDLKATPEKQMASGAGIDYEALPQLSPR